MLSFFKYFPLFFCFFFFTAQCSTTKFLIPGSSKKETIKYIQFTPEGDSLKKRYEGYRKNIVEEINEDISIFVNYDEKFRPIEITLQKGTLSGAEELTGLRAYQVKTEFSETAKPDVANYGSNMKIYYKTLASADFSLFILDEGILKLAREFKTEEIQNGFIDLDTTINLMKSGLPGKIQNRGVFLLVPSSVAAKIERVGIAAELTYKTFDVSGTPFDTYIEDKISPSDHANSYGSKPQIVPSSTGKNLLVAWDDKETNSVHISEIDATYSTITKDLKLEKHFPVFGGFTSDNTGHYYILYTKDNKDGDFSSNIKLVKYDSQGTEIGSYSLPSNREGYDVMIPISGATSRLVYGNGKVAVHMGKTQFKNKSDGLNHQSGILFVVDTESMQLDDSLSLKWTSSHSFDQRLIFDGKDFVHLDLADNYPRGFRITKNGKGKVVFTYKTEHGKTPVSPAGKKLGIGKWSNDNRTYSELGGLAKSSKGYIVLGASEQSFDNSRTGKILNESRNLFYVLVTPDFGDKPKVKVDEKEQENVVSKEVVISSGEDSSLNEFYDFGGNLNYQKRVGVIWLTHFEDPEKENVTRPRLLKIGEDKFLALWEKWSSTNYITTQYIVFDAAGKILVPLTNLGGVRLNRGDEPIYSNGNLIWVTGKKNSKQLRLNRIDIEKSGILDRN